MAEPALTFPIDETVPVEVTQPGDDGQADMLLTTLGGFELAIVGKASVLESMARQVLAQLDDLPPDVPERRHSARPATRAFRPRYPTELGVGWWVQRNDGSVWALDHDPITCETSPRPCMMLTLRHRGSIERVHVSPNETVKAHPPLPRPAPAQPSLDGARAMTDDYHDRVARLLAQEPADGEALDRTGGAA